MFLETHRLQLAARVVGPLGCPQMGHSIVEDIDIGISAPRTSGARIFFSICRQQHCPTSNFIRSIIMRKL